MKDLFSDDSYTVFPGGVRGLKAERNPLLSGAGDFAAYAGLCRLVGSPGYSSRLASPRYAGLRGWLWSKTPALGEGYGAAVRAVWVLNGMSAFPVCPTCGRPYGEGAKVTLSRPYRDHCCSKCANSDPSVVEKVAGSVFRRFGVRSYAQTAEYREKSRASFMRRYGVDHNMKCEKGRLEWSESCRARTGYDHNWKDPACRGRCVETAKARHGEDYTGRAKARLTAEARFGKPSYFQTDEFRERAAETSRRNWGVDSPAQAEEVKARIRETNEVRLGVPHSMMDPGVRAKRVETYRLRYGADNPMQCAEIRRRAQKRYVYDGIHFDSKPEIAFYVWLRDNGVDFEYQPDAGFEYEFEGGVRRYFPDFRVGGTYYEIKGSHMIGPDGSWICPWDRSQDPRYRAKQECAARNGVVVLDEAVYAGYLEYAEGKYGRGWLDGLRAAP